jgi:hypothetical protein
MTLDEDTAALDMATRAESLARLVLSPGGASTARIVGAQEVVASIQRYWMMRARRVVEQSDAVSGGEWRHCSPELIGSGLDCEITPRRPCLCPYNGSHDHYIASSPLQARGEF